MEESEKFAFEIGLIAPKIAGPPLYKYTILTLKPMSVLFHGYGGEIGEVRETAKAHIAFLEGADVSNAGSRQVGRVI